MRRGAGENVPSRSSWWADAFRGDELRALVLEAFAVRDRGVDIRSGVAGAVATAGPLVVGVGTGNRSAGLIAAIGGLNTALCVPRAGLNSRIWWGALGAVGGCGAVVLADLTAGHSWLLALATLVWVGIWAWLRAAGPAGALAGFATSAVLVVLAGIPPGGPPLASRELWFAIGAAAALTLMVPARRGPRSPAGVASRALAAVWRAARTDAAIRAFASRLAVSVALATLLERWLKLPHGYWVPLTVLAVLQPGEHATRVRCIQRAAGTLVGVVLIIAITLATDEVWVLIAASAVASLTLFALDERGYFWLVVAITPTALLMLSIGDFQGLSVGVERTLNSALGIVLGLAIGEVAWRIGPRLPIGEHAPPVTGSRQG